MMRKSLVECMIVRWRSSELVPAIIFGAAVNALSYVRSLGRRGVPVVCAETYRGAAGRSRYGMFAQLEIEPGEDVAGERAAGRLLGQFNERGIEPVVFGTADQWQVYLARRAASVSCGIRSLVPSDATMDRIIDKQAQYEFAVNLGIGVPAFANAREVFDGRASWDVFPAIIKPRWAHAGRAAIGGKAVAVRDAAELRSALARLDAEVDVAAYLVQEMIDGRDDCLYAYLGCYDQDHREVSWLVKRKLRQHPPTFGDGSLDATCVDDEVAAAGRTLMAGLAYRGMVGIEFKRDATAGALSMIEINPRTVSTNQLAITAGVDFPWQAYGLMVGDSHDTSEAVGREADQADHPYRVGVHHVNEEREIRSFLRRWRAGETGFFQWMGEMLGAESYALWDRRDPRPFVWSMWRLMTGRLRANRKAGDAAAGTGDVSASHRQAARMTTEAERV